MPNNPEMSKFLYTIVKQLDLKTIDWNLVSSELGITNGHAARMRYSRFKQQMEGNTPVRRARNPNGVKRTPKAKRTKEENNDGSQVKTEEESSMTNSMASTPTTPGESQPTPVSMTPEAVMVKREPREDSVPSIAPSTMAQLEYSHQGMHMQSADFPEQRDQPEQINPQALQRSNATDYAFQCAQPQLQHHQRMYPPAMGPHVHEMMEQHLGHDMVMIEQHDLQPFMSPELFYHINDMDCHGHVTGNRSMIKAEERWDSSYDRA